MISGSHRTREGKDVNITIPEIINAKKGNEPRTTSPKGFFETPWRTKRFMPTGGVSRPASINITKITPNQIGSKPDAMIAGDTTEIVIIIIDRPSMKHPKNRYMAHIRDNVTSGDRCQPSSNVENALGTLATARKLENILAATIMNIIMQVVSSVLEKDSLSICQLKLRNTSAMINDAKLPSAAASVGVKIPPKMPPKMMPTSNTMGQRSLRQKSAALSENAVSLGANWGLLTTLILI